MTCLAILVETTSRRCCLGHYLVLVILINLSRHTDFIVMEIDASRAVFAGVTPLVLLCKQLAWATFVEAPAGGANQPDAASCLGADIESINDTICSFRACLRDAIAKRLSVPGLSAKHPSNPTIQLRSLYKTEDWVRKAGTGWPCEADTTARSRELGET